MTQCRATICHAEFRHARSAHDWREGSQDTTWGLRSWFFCFNLFSGRSIGSGAGQSRWASTCDHLSYRGANNRGRSGFRPDESNHVPAYAPPETFCTTDDIGPRTSGGMRQCAALLISGACRIIVTHTMCSATAGSAGAGNKSNACRSTGASKASRVDYSCTRATTAVPREKTRCRAHIDYGGARGKTGSVAAMG